MATKDRPGWTPTERENVAVVRRFNTGLNAHDLTVFDDLTSGEVTTHFLGAGPEELTWVVDHPDAFREYHTTMLEAIPDFEGSIEDIIADEDRVLVRATVRGTLQKEYRSMPPTGRSFEVPAVYMYRLENGRIAEMWSLTNTLGMLQQLGLFPDSAGSVGRLLAHRLRRSVFGGRR